MLQHIFSSFLSCTSAYNTIARTRAERSQRKSERFEQHRLAIRQRRAARHERYVNVFKRAGSAFRMWWLMLLGVMTRVADPSSREKNRRSTVRAMRSRKSTVAQADVLETRQLLTIDLISTVAPEFVAATGDANSSDPVLSADGTKVVFASAASNLVFGDNNNQADIFLKDLTTGLFTRVTTSVDGVEANHASFDPVLSADGTKVAFHTLASNLKAGGSAILVKDLTTGIVMNGSSNASGQSLSSTGVGDPVLSADGTTVAFWGLGSLTENASLNVAKIYVKN